MALISNFLEKTYNNNKLLLVFVFSFSLIFSLIFLFFLKNIGPQEHGIPGTDYYNYYKPIAENILQGKGFVLHGKDISGIGFVYPFFIAGVIFFSDASGISPLCLIVFFNVLLASFSSCFLFLFVKEIFNKRIALFSSFLWLTYPFNLWLLKNPNTEVPFIFFFFLSILFFVFSVKKKKQRYFLLSGFFLAVSLATKLIVLFLPIVFVVFIILFLKSAEIKARILSVVFFFLGLLIVILPWFFYISPANNIFITLPGRTPNTIVSGITWFSEKGEREILSEDVKRFITKMRSQDLNTFGKTAGFFAREAIQRPIPVMKIIWLKLSRSWYGTSSRWKEEPLILAIQLFYIISAIFGLRIVLKRKTEISFVIFILLIILYFWAMIFSVVSIMRYMIPVMGLVMIFSAAAIDKLLNALFKKYGQFRFSNNSLQK